MRPFLLFLSFLFSLNLFAVQTGLDRLFSTEAFEQLRGHHIGLIANQSSIDRTYHPAVERLVEGAERGGYQVVAILSPEHGYHGEALAGERLQDGREGTLPIYTLHGSSRRPTDRMLEGIDLLIYDLQDVGVRCYTYISTLFACMEEAARHHIPLMVLDRPNPMNGLIVDGPMMDQEWRSFVGYAKIPFCHGMTVGELADYYNRSEKVGCNLAIVKMEGWTRSMTYLDTGLPWIPTSPHMPEPTTPLYYSMTNLIGEILDNVSNGVGTTQPFKVVGAPWIDPIAFTKACNELELPGVQFQATYFRPFFGRFEGKTCGGVRPIIVDPLEVKPVRTQLLLIGLLRTLYPDEYAQGLARDPEKLQLLHKLCGSPRIAELCASEEEPYIGWGLVAIDALERESFCKEREKYLLYP